MQGSRQSRLRRSGLRPLVVILLASSLLAACDQGSSRKTEDPTKPLDRAGFIAELRANFPKYKWPSDYRPNLATLAEYAAPPAGSVIPPGGSQLVLGIYSQCAWELSWYAADERGDSTAAAAALKQLTDYVPTLQDSVGGGREKALRIARQASLGDASQALSDAKANCGPDFWKANP